MNLLQRFAMPVLVLLACWHNVSALEFSAHNLNNKHVLLLEGGFDEGDSQRFSQAIQRVGRIDEIWFNSPGGSVDEGMDIGRKIRSLGLATKVPANAKCMSICAFAFLGGVVREIDPNGVYGVHMFSKMCNDEALQSVVKQITALVKAEGDKGSIKIAALLLKTEQDSATTARDQANYLLEMEVSVRLLFPNYETFCTKIRPLTRAELVSYNVINTEN